MSTRCPWVVGSAWCPAKRYSASPSLIALLRTVFHALGRVNPSPEFAGGHDAHLSFSSKPMLKLFIKSLVLCSRTMPIPALFRVVPSAKGESIGQIRRETVARRGGPRWRTERDARARRGARRHRAREPQQVPFQAAGFRWSLASFQHR